MPLPLRPPQVLPSQLNDLLIIVVVTSMALTPVLAEVGKRASEAVEERWPEVSVAALSEGGEAPASGERREGGAEVVSERWGAAAGGLAHAMLGLLPRGECLVASVNGVGSLP